MVKISSLCPGTGSVPVVSCMCTWREHGAIWRRNPGSVLFSPVVLDITSETPTLWSQVGKCGERSHASLLAGASSSRFARIQQRVREASATNASSPRRPCVTSRVPQSGCRQSGASGSAARRPHGRMRGVVPPGRGTRPTPGACRTGCSPYLSPQFVVRRDGLQRSGRIFR